MSLYAISDLHLSFSVNKPMDIFPSWENYSGRLQKNWEAKIKQEDVVVIPGDISWGMTLEEAKEDFAFLHRLPGQKIIFKGNHDYWFTTKKKTEDFWKSNGFNTLNMLWNNSYEYENYAIGGTRGWTLEIKEETDKKILQRELGRMQLSLDSMRQKPLIFMHYPPLYKSLVFKEMIALFHKYHVTDVYYGHLHHKSCRYALTGDINGINYHLISADYLQFNPIKLK